MKLKLNWDALGVTASVACAIHCAILPLFATAVPLFGVNNIHNVAFETVMVVLAFCIGTYSFYHGYRKHHQSLWPFSLFAIGITLLVLKLFFIHYETWLLLPAVVLIICSHVMNYRYCRVQRHDHGAHCDH